MWGKGETNHQEQPWGKVLFPFQWIQRAISLRDFAETETPSRWENLTLNHGMLPTSLQTPDRLDLKVDNVDSHLPHYQPIRRMCTSWSHPLWTIVIKLLTIFHKLEHMVLRASAHCVPLSLANNKATLSYFTQNSVSKIWLGTGVQRSWAFSATFTKLWHANLFSYKWNKISGSSKSLTNPPSALFKLRTHYFLSTTLNIRSTELNKVSTFLKLLSVGWNVGG